MNDFPLQIGDLLLLALFVWLYEELYDNKSLSEQVVIRKWVVKAGLLLILIVSGYLLFLN